MIARNFLLDKMNAGVLSVGTWCTLPSAAMTEVLATAGMDFVVIDREHGAITLETAEHMVRAAEMHKCSPLVRVPQLDDAEILRALDIGAHGVIVPQIESADQAAQAADAAMYAPKGRRGFSPYTRNAGFSHVKADAAQQRHLNDNTILGLLVEGPEGLAALDEIMRAADGRAKLVYIGPYDLANAIGRPGDVDHPEVVAEVRRSFDVIRKHGAAPSTLARNADEAARYAAAGAKALAYQGDVGLVHEIASSVVRSVRSLAKEAA